MSEHDNIHHPIDKVIKDGKIISMYSRYAISLDDGRKISPKVFLQTAKSEIVAMDFSLYSEQYAAYPEYYMVDSYIDSEDDGVYIRTWQHGAPKYTAVKLAQKLGKNIKAAGFAMIENARIRIRYYEDMDPANPLKDDWTAWIASIKSVWADTIKPDLTALAQANNYAGIIAYDWMAAIPEMPEE